MVNHEQSNKNFAILSPHEFPSAEPDTVQAWRRASNAVSMQVQETASYMQGFIQCGGPEAITALKATIKRLQAELEESKGVGQVQRYRALQQDLKQRDAVCAALRGLVKAQCGMPDAAIEEQLDAKVLKHDCLYGASREHLLRENRSLRSALESRLITIKTTAPAPLKSTAVVGANGTKDSRTPPEGVQHLAALLQATARLDAAQREHGPPTMRNAFTQADDGASSLLSIMEEQTRTLAAQKAQLLQKVAEGASALSLCERRADAAESELADMRRQKTELMYHQVC
ncbi:hypothetical protein DUNSADRAFT_14562 [Dunaliella salina]|uniref:Uncharacterized protein n=1 Tax=Dunaliella salina TaxID=3046 RepID=A0ABQ7G758_DUNSA|nr:hypothetical protein DUNSADRAFT_14562 [Dunaliella salina]|eukprot:KAF5830444.1 hypothetical protein DUNSADRAFT_14562 [Dunaliella salina]